MQALIFLSVIVFIVILAIKLWYIIVPIGLIALLLHLKKERESEEAQRALEEASRRCPKCSSVDIVERSQTEFYTTTETRERRLTTDHYPDGSERGYTTEEYEVPVTNSTTVYTQKCNACGHFWVGRQLYGSVHGKSFAPASGETRSILGAFVPLIVLILFLSGMYLWSSHRRKQYRINHQEIAAATSAAQKADVAADVIYFTRVFMLTPQGQTLEGRIYEHAGKAGGIIDRTEWVAEPTADGMYEIAAKIPAGTGTIIYTFIVDRANKAVRPSNKVAKVLFSEPEKEVADENISESKEPQAPAIREQASAAESQTETAVNPEADTARYDAFAGPYIAVPWTKAADYCKKNGGRLPTVKELQKIRKAECTTEQLSDRCHRGYLSSQESGDRAKAVSFYDGEVVYAVETVAFFSVRCVQ